MAITFVACNADPGVLSRDPCTICEGAGCVWCDFLGFHFAVKGSTPEVRLAPGTAGTLLRSMGYEPASHGYWDTTTLPEVEGRIHRALGTKGTIRRVCASVERVGNVIDPGFSEDLVTERLRDLLELVTAARKEGRPVGWA